MFWLSQYAPDSHLPCYLLHHTNCFCSLKEKAGSNRTQNAVIITLSTSFLELAWRSSRGFIWIKLPLPVPFPLGFLHSSAITYHGRNILTLRLRQMLWNGTGEHKQAQRPAITTRAWKDQTGNSFSCSVDFPTTSPKFHCCFFKYLHLTSNSECFRAAWHPGVGAYPFPRGQGTQLLCR